MPRIGNISTCNYPRTVCCVPADLRLDVCAAHPGETATPCVRVSVFDAGLGAYTQ